MAPGNQMKYDLKESARISISTKHTLSSSVH